MSDCEYVFSRVAIITHISSSAPPGTQQGKLLFLSARPEKYQKVSSESGRHLALYQAAADRRAKDPASECILYCCSMSPHQQPMSKLATKGQRRASATKQRRPPLWTPSHPWPETTMDPWPEETSTGYTWTTLKISPNSPKRLFSLDNDSETEPS